jgi:hypothetical protein
MSKFTDWREENERELESVEALDTEELNNRFQEDSNFYEFLKDIENGEE